MKTLFLLLLLFSALICLPQQIEILGTEQITKVTDGEFYYPRFNPEGKKLLVTSKTYDGLSLINLETKGISILNSLTEAGSSPEFTMDGKKIYFKISELVKKRKFYAMYAQDIESSGYEVLENGSRDLTDPHIINNQVVYISSNEIKRVKASRNVVSEKVESDVLAFIEGMQIAVVKSNQKNYITPQGEGGYVWLTLSPNHTKILFTRTSSGTFICDLDGKILTDFESLESPRWINDQWIVGMIEHHEKSKPDNFDLFIYSSDGKTKVQLTNTPDVNEFFPSGSLQSDKIAFSNDKGEIFILKIAIK
jgi:Tol biopolymer transport system component